MSDLRMRSTKEYDEFGPWIDEVRTVADLPRLYQGAGIDPAAYQLVLKVPRNIERRNANPDMHLYDYLIAVDEETLTVLGRRGDIYDSYDTVRVPLDQVVAFEDNVRLLDGRLTVHTAGGASVTVSYNGSANAPIRNLIRVLRRWYLPEAPLPAAGPVRAEPPLGRQDTGLLTDYHRLMDQEPGLRLVNTTRRQTVTPISRLERLYRKAWPLTLHATITVTDDREIQVIHRRDWFTPGTDDISLARTVLPRSRISAVTVHPHDRYLGVHVVVVQAGATWLQFPVAASPLTDAILAGRRAGN